jgi:hypothetical protein
VVHSLHHSLNCAPVALSADARTVRLSDHLRVIPETHSIAVFVGAMARGRDDFADGIVDEKISISNYSLSASVACGKVWVLSPPWLLGFAWLILSLFSSAVHLRTCGTLCKGQASALTTRTPLVSSRSFDACRSNAKRVSCFCLANLVFNYPHVFQHTYVVPSSPTLFLHLLDPLSQLQPFLSIRTLTIRTIRCITTSYLSQKWKQRLQQSTLE